MSLRDFTEKAENYLLSIINGNKLGFGPSLIKSNLFVLSKVFRSIVKSRHFLYDKRIFRDRTLGCLVVSIGNLTTGGTGKTPVTEIFARTLCEKGRRVAILSRGYRSKSKPLKTKILDKFRGKKTVSPPRIVSEGKNEVLLGPHMAGDEPYMLACNVPEAIVLTDPDRVKSGRFAIRNYQADTLLMDDGFQQLRLKPRINILLIDSTNPFSNHFLLPRGLLREPIKNMRRAHFIFLTKANGGNHLRHLKKFIRKHNTKAEIIECTHRPKYLKSLINQQQSLLSVLKGKKIAAISAIAVPQSFEDFLIGFGAEIVYKERYADHHMYYQDEVETFIKNSESAEAELIVTTEKDAVRFPEIKNSSIDITYLRVEIDILSGEESFNECISRICFS